MGVTEARFPAVQFDRLQDLLADVPCHHTDDRNGISHKCVARGGRCGRRSLVNGAGGEPATAVMRSHCDYNT